MATLMGGRRVTAAADAPAAPRCSTRHKALGAKMVPFAGWEMPVQYPTGILAEHHAVRTGAGIFDVSHMGEFEITGPDRNAFVNRVTSNDVVALEPGGVQYSGAAHARGHLRRRLHRLPLRRQADDRGQRLEHGAAPGSTSSTRRAAINVRLKDISDEVGLLAVQGPRAEALLQPLADTPLGEIALLPLRRRARSPARSASSPAPATPARTASSSTAASATRWRSGTRSPRPAPSRSGSARATRSGWRWATRSTATRSTTPSRRSRPASAGS